MCISILYFQIIFSMVIFILNCFITKSILKSFTHICFNWISSQAQDTIEDLHRWKGKENSASLLHSWIGSILHDMLSCPCVYAFINPLRHYGCYMHRRMALTYRRESQPHSMASEAFCELNPVFISPDILGYIWSFCRTGLFLIPATCWPFYASLPSLLNYPKKPMLTSKAARSIWHILQPPHHSIIFQDIFPFLGCLQPLFKP